MVTLSDWARLRQLTQSINLKQYQFEAISIFFRLTDWQTYILYTLHKRIQKLLDRRYGNNRFNALLVLIGCWLLADITTGAAGRARNSLEWGAVWFEPVCTMYSVHVQCTCEQICELTSKHKYTKWNVNTCGTLLIRCMWQKLSNF